MMTGTGDPEEAASLLGIGVVVVKMGARGVMAWDGEHVMVDALRTECIDTTGAGDAFNAGFLYAWLAGFSLEVSCRFGNYIASRCIEGYGATGSLPGTEALDVLRRYAEG